MKPIDAPRFSPFSRLRCLPALIALAMGVGCASPQADADASASEDALRGGDDTAESHHCLFGNDATAIFANKDADFQVAQLAQARGSNAKALDQSATGLIRGAIDTYKQKMTNGDPKRYALESLIEDHTDPANGVIFYQVLHRPTNQYFFGTLIHYPLTETIQGGGPLNAGQKLVRPYSLKGWYISIHAPYSADAKPSMQPDALVEQSMKVIDCWVNSKLEKTWTSPSM